MTSRERQKSGDYEDDHHILNNRQEWELRPEARRLRRNPALIARIPRSEHNEIHVNCPPVPPLGYFVLTRTVKLFEPIRGNVLKSVDNLLFAMESASNDPRNHPIEREMTELSIEAIELQKPYLGHVAAKAYFDMGCYDVA